MTHPEVKHPWSWLNVSSSSSCPPENFSWPMQEVFWSENRHFCDSALITLLQWPQKMVSVLSESWVVDFVGSECVCARWPGVLTHFWAFSDIDWIGYLVDFEVVFELLVVQAWRDIWFTPSPITGQDATSHPEMSPPSGLSPLPCHRFPASDLSPPSDLSPQRCTPLRLVTTHGCHSLSDLSPHLNVTPYWLVPPTTHRCQPP